MLYLHAKNFYFTTKFISFMYKMLKRNSFFFLLLFVCLIVQASNTFKIHGIIHHAKDSAYVEYSYMRWQDKQWVKVADTARIVNDKFEICGEVDRLTMVTLYYSDLPAIHAFVEQGETTLHWDANDDWKYTQEGTNIDGDIKLYRHYMQDADSLFTIAQKDFLISLNNINKEIQAGLPAEKMDSISMAFRTLMKEREILQQKNARTLLDLIKSHSELRIAPLLMYELLGDESLDADEVFVVAEMVSRKAGNMPECKLLQDEIRRMKATYQPKVGQEPYDFIRKSLDGKDIKLSSYRGKKVVLLDFWASWCVPCIKNFSALKNLHAKYADKGLEIIGVSCDRLYDDYKTAVEKSHLPWVNVLAKSDGEDLSEVYKAEAIPLYILIDKTGIIVSMTNEIAEKEEALIQKLLE